MADTEASVRAAAELRPLLREAHEMIKDLRRELKEARTAIEDDVKRASREIGELAGGVGVMCNELLGEWAEKVGRKCPLTMLCPGCGVILAGLAGDREDCRWSACGKRFRTSSFTAGVGARDENAAEG